MAKFKAELPTELIKQFEKLNKDTEKMMGEMTKAGAEVAYNNVVANMRKAFKTPKSLISRLKITRVYHTPSDDGINTKIAVYGYKKNQVWCTHFHCSYCKLFQCIFYRYRPLP